MESWLKRGVSTADAKDNVKKAVPDIGEHAASTASRTVWKD